MDWFQIAVVSCLAVIALACVVFIWSFACYLRLIAHDLYRIAGAAERIKCDIGLLAELAKMASSHEQSVQNNEAPRKRRHRAGRKHRRNRRYVEGMNTYGGRDDFDVQ